MPDKRRSDGGTPRRQRTRRGFKGRTSGSRFKFISTKIFARSQSECKLITTACLFPYHVSMSHRGARTMIGGAAEAKRPIVGDTVTNIMIITKLKSILATMQLAKELAARKMSTKAKSIFVTPTGIVDALPLHPRGIFNSQLFNVRGILDARPFRPRLSLFPGFSIRAA